jgi:hypothetical protein
MQSSDQVMDVDTLTLRDGGGRAKLRFLTRQHIDGRTRARKQFDKIIEGITNDLGGADAITTVQQQLIEAAASCSVMLDDLNARQLRGENVTVLRNQTSITLLRIASRLGISKRQQQKQQKDKTPPPLPSSSLFTALQREHLKNQPPDYPHSNSNNNHGDKVITDAVIVADDKEEGSTR